ncbi:MAG: hypothetical protein WC718_00295 [Phycisphaerales bacterium]|jgi:hypothetical protein
MISELEYSGPPPEKCPTHGLYLDRDGECPECRREALPDAEDTNAE